MKEQDKELIEDLRYIARYPHNYHASYICRKAADRMEELAEREHWYSKEDPFLKRLWGRYRQEMKDDDMEVIVMIAGATVPTVAVFDGHDFYSGIDPVPVIWWRPLPSAPEN